MKLMTIAKVVEQLKAEDLMFGEGKLRRAIKAGKIPYMMIGSRALVDIDDVRTLIRDGGGIGIEELSQEIGLKCSAIRRGIKEGWIPYKVNGRAYEFDMDEVLFAIEAKMKKQ
ncbi:hypothetical protein LJC33_07345 [Eubacteriales bacterium OttesenSCG-928-N13]|nr:hypothetical protein [Eubacteriales bacterium OttesenSCG-928-N13]